MSDFNKTVKELNFPKRIIHCRPNTPIADVMAGMVEKDIGAVVITEDRKPVGIVTERDYLTKLSGKDVDLSGPISDIMTDHPTTVGEDENIMNVVKNMRLGNFRRMIVVDAEGKLVCVISIRDIMEFFAHTIDSKGL
jgi:CBS domain-containing protein